MIVQNKHANTGEIFAVAYMMSYPGLVISSSSITEINQFDIVPLKVALEPQFSILFSVSGNVWETRGHECIKVLLVENMYRSIGTISSEKLSQSRTIFSIPSME